MQIAQDVTASPEVTNYNEFCLEAATHLSREYLPKL